MPPLSKTDLAAALHELRSVVATKEDIRDLIRHFNESQGAQNKTLNEQQKTLNEQQKTLNEQQKTLNELQEMLKDVQLKVNAILEMGAVREEVQNLVRELKAQGIPLDERRIFITHPTAAGS